MAEDDRAYLIQQVTAFTGLTGVDAERRVDTVIADSKKAISRTRASTVILAFSVATALLLGAVAAWAGAVAGGRHRDGMPLPNWMSHANRFHRRKALPQRPIADATKLSLATPVACSGNIYQTFLWDLCKAVP